VQYYIVISRTSFGNVGKIKWSDGGNWYLESTMFYCNFMEIIWQCWHSLYGTFQTNEIRCQTNYMKFNAETCRNISLSRPGIAHNATLSGTPGIGFGHSNIPSPLQIHLSFYWQPHNVHLDHPLTSRDSEDTIIIITFSILSNYVFHCGGRDN